MHAAATCPCHPARSRRIHARCSAPAGGQVADATAILAALPRMPSSARKADSVLRAGWNSPPAVSAPSAREPASAFASSRAKGQQTR